MTGPHAPVGHRLLLRCYPAAWRERYGDEFLALLAERRLGIRELADILVGAADARRNRVTPRPAGIAGLSLMAAPVTTTPVGRSSWGVVAGPPVGEMSRRAFMRRMLGAGAALLTLEFTGGVLAFLWPQIRTGLGATFALGTVDDILLAQPSFATGYPYPYNPARIFLVNVPAAKSLALGQSASIANPTGAELLALWRKCPHLGCLIPDVCDSVKRYRCRCHGSTYNILGEKLDKGPAERGMDRFAVSIRPDGVVVVDTSQITRGAPNLGEDALVFHDAAPYTATCSEL